MESHLTVCVWHAGGHSFGGQRLRSFVERLDMDTLEWSSVAGKIELEGPFSCDEVEELRQLVTTLVEDVCSGNWHNTGLVFHRAGVSQLQPESLC